ncbi:S41 family peptidase [Spongiivirga citrea]|uniref:Peptidase n=1 Tax=Spongiivirga citrea TaxID=1481457 RepID=A0A6M0CR57_9FLAO|nr:S41 family peptidase [Spongiivirga citrea]NER18564.1 peptidase [Spongiivirga citrea]
MKKITFLLFAMFSISCSSQSKYEKDFLEFWELIDESYAYFHDKQTNWDEVKVLYAPEFKKVESGYEFVYLFEKMIYELYDSHITINTNIDSSFQQVPDKSDAWLEYRDGGYYIVDIREGFTADKAGLEIGMKIESINNIDFDKAVQKELPISFDDHNNEVHVFIANLVFSGDRVNPRKVEVVYKGQKQQFTLENPKRITTDVFNNQMLTTKKLNNNIGYIRVNNCLSNYDLVNHFDKTVDELYDTNGLIIDLRETAGGGNTVVARAILGKFLNKEVPYQKHEQPYEEKQYGVKRSWIEYAFPFRKFYNKPVVVLVGHWTGSVGEALGVAFSTFDNVTVVGTKMAGLQGGVNCQTLTGTNISVCYPFEKIFQVNGESRKSFIPEVHTKSFKETYDIGLKTLEKAIK